MSNVQDFSQLLEDETPETWPPEGWTVHPKNPDYLYRGQEVISAADLRARMAPPPAAPAAPEPPATPAAPDPINPPEAAALDPVAEPPQAPPPPAGRIPDDIEEDPDTDGPDLEAMDRAALKALAVSRGLIEESSRLRKPALLDLLRGSSSGPAPAAPAAPAAPEPPAPPAAPAAPEPPAKAARPTRVAPPKNPADHPDTGTIGTLYVDCLPLGGAAVQLADPILEAAARKAAEVSGLPDYRLIDYGKGPGLFVAAVREELDAAGPLAEVYLDTRRSDRGRAAADAFKTAADRVVIGV